MSTPFRHRPQRFMQTVGGGSPAASSPTSSPTAAGTGQNAGTTQSGSTDSLGSQYKAIFEQQMAQQFELFRIITEENDRKNEQSSHLALAKGVSEMV